ncbi:hypothetical protein H8356DRAFT_1666244 [Neocallimastix lanati (nom. inval.)]|jgi:hypothetical protein|nr:hypothetical protein H8356DRAFT_1666244 [Neocallimastix sp. JGI-2020a]
MLSPFRLFRSRPNNGIRVDEDDTNYENLLGTATGSDVEDEEDTTTTTTTQNTSTQNQNRSNQTSTQQNSNTSFSNNNDIFGDFSHFNNMGNVPTTTAVNSNSNDNKDNSSNFDGFNIFSNDNNINLFSNNSNNSINKRIGSAGDINKLYDKSKNPYSPNNPRFQDNKMVSSISESQIFNRNNESIDLLGFNNTTSSTSNTVSNTANNHNNRINDIFGDFANFQNAFTFNPQNNLMNSNTNSKDTSKDTSKSEANNNNNNNNNNKIDDTTTGNNKTEGKETNNKINNESNIIDKKEINVSNINEDDNDLFGDFNSHDTSFNNDNLFANFTPVITDKTNNTSNNFFSPDFAEFSTTFSSATTDKTNNDGISSIPPPPKATSSSSFATSSVVNTPSKLPSHIVEFDAFALNSSTSSSNQPVSYDLFSNYEPSQKTSSHLNNKISFESNAESNTEYDENLLFSPIIGDDHDKKDKMKDKQNNKKDENNNNKDKNSNNDRNKENNNNKNSNNNNNNNNINNINNEGKNTNVSTPTIMTTTGANIRDAKNPISSPSRKTSKDKENKKDQSPVKFKNSKNIKNDHISSNDIRMKFGDGKEANTSTTTPTTPTATAATTTTDSFSISNTNKSVPKVENILDLPPDILLYILTFVSLEELPKLAQLCRRFKLLVYNDTIYEQKLQILGLDYISTDEWMAMNKPDTQNNKTKYNQNSQQNGHFLPSSNSKFSTSDYSTSMMKINELNDYLLTGRKSLLNLEKLNDSSSKDSLPNSTEENKKEKKKDQSKNNKKKDDEFNLFSKDGNDEDDNNSYKISPDFNIFAKEDEYNSNKNQGMYKAGSNESVDILNIEGTDQYENQNNKTQNSEGKDKDKNKTTATATTAATKTTNNSLTVGTNDQNKEKKEEDKKSKSEKLVLSPQTKLQMSFKMTPREVFKKECQELLRYYLDFKHPLPYKYLIFEDYSDINDIAKLLRRLVKFNKGKFVTEWKTIQENINTTVVDFEDLLQSEFEENYNDLDLENLSNISKAYQELNGGAPLVQFYLSKCQLFYDPKFNYSSLAMYKNNISDPSLSSTNLQSTTLGPDGNPPEPMSPIDEGNDLIVQYTSFINRLISVVREQYYQIKAIFPYESDALHLFLQKVIEDILSDYLSATVEHARRIDSTVYLTLLSTLVLTTMNIVEVIGNWDKEYEKEHPREGSKFSYQAIVGELQSIIEPFTQFYVQDEITVLKKQYKEEIDKWKEERENRKKADTGFLDGDVESYKRNVMKTFKSVLLAPAVMTKNLMGKNKKADAAKETKTHLDDNAITDSLSLELSLSLIHMNKEALKRCQMIMEIMNEDVGKCAEKLFIVLIKFLDTEHIAPSFQLAAKRLANENRLVTDENHGTQSIIKSLVTFFELIHIADLIQQMVHVYYMEDIVKYVDENDFMSDIIVEKKQFERHLDDLVAQGMDKSIQVLIDNIEFTLINELPLDAYDVQSENQVLDLKPTKVCLKIVEFLSYHSKMIIGVTDKNTVNVLYEEISIRLFNIFVKNLKRMRISLLGAQQLICDLNHYCVWARTLRNPATTKIFTVLKEVGNLFIVDTAQDLKRIVLDTDRYGGYLRRDDIDDLLKCRPDYKEIQHIIETKDCIIQ